jgi:PAS domain S-box-containing protein
MDLGSFLDHIDDAVIIVKQGVVEELNASFHRISGMEIDAIKGKSVYDLEKAGTLKKSSAAQVIAQKKPLSMRTQYNNENIVSWSGVPVMDEDGEVEYVIGTARDITEIIDLEKKLDEMEKLKNKYHDKLSNLEISIGKTDIIFSGKEMHSVVDVAMKAAKSDSNVFIWGESGVGKELIASLVHKLSSRKDKPFIAINCASIPENLLESELFGYANGAFTGAKKGGKKGLFQEANGGTVFLDEIGEMPTTMQSKLLRILQSGEVKPLGENKNIKINTRVISSTNVPLNQLRNNSEFRRDLFYRLNVIPIYVPPLRDRRDDIPVLVEHFLKVFNKQYKTHKRCSKKLLKLLYSYEWPGNVRQLRNIVERMVTLSDRDELLEEDMSMFELEMRGSSTYSDDAIMVNEIMPLKTAIQRFENIIITKALNQYGSIVKAAEALGIDQSTLHRKRSRWIVTDDAK